MNWNSCFLQIGLLEQYFLKKNERKQYDDFVEEFALKSLQKNKKMVSIRLF